jgi:hypothetical protein
MSMEVLNEQEICRILDEAAESHHFPMLDNGYVYPAATRLALFRSPLDWAMVIEVFGYSPRAGEPNTCVATFGSQLCGRRSLADYVNETAYKNYLATHPNDDCTFVHPIESFEWIDPEDAESVVQSAEVKLRDKIIPLPDSEAYEKCSISLSGDRPSVFEFCRYLAEHWRNDVLATPEEQRSHVPPVMEKILQLEEWDHPDLSNGELPSHLVTFEQLARVLATGDASHYAPVSPPNTHWSNWPDGGTL